MRNFIVSKPLKKFTHLSSNMTCSHHSESMPNLIEQVINLLFSKNAIGCFAVLFLGIFMSPNTAFGQYTAIPDANFEQKLIDLGVDSEGTLDGQILTTDATAQNGTLNVSSSSIADLTGIEAFINLTQLNCSVNQLTSLDVRNGKNTNFVYFEGLDNSLTCISVDNPDWSTTNWTNKDEDTYFGSDCLCPSPGWSVPGASATSVTSDASCIDADGWTHYLDSADEEILLSIKIDAFGAVVPRTAITLDPDGGTNVFWVASASGKFVSNLTGAAFMKRKWDVNPTTQPSSPVAVQFYYTTDEYNAVNTEIFSHGGTPLTDHTQMRFYKILNDSDPFNLVSLNASDGIDLGHGTPSTTNWEYNAFGFNHYGEFLVDAFSGGGGGGASGGGAVLPIELDLPSKLLRIMSIFFSFRSLS